MGGRVSARPGGIRMTTARFDELIHAPLRLRICATLAAVDSASFSTVRTALGVSDSVVSKHVATLESAGYLVVRKHTVLSRVHTSLALTPAGRTALRGHLAALNEIAKLASPVGRGVGRGR
jgi:DNA-binding MarR family transcriptional regulator